MQDGTILLVEDNQDDVDLTLRAFKKNNIGNKVVVARDGVEALDHLFGASRAPEAPWPVVVLLDLKLPRIDGLEVLRRIRADERTRTLPVVILTSSSSAISSRATTSAPTATCASPSTSVASSRRRDSWAFIGSC
jgi:two-component system response regulator